MATVKIPSVKVDTKISTALHKKFKASAKKKKTTMSGALRGMIGNYVKY